MSTHSERVFFPGLNELRAFAALAVVFHHVELYKYRNGMASLYDTKLRHLISHLGHNGVSLFFVLSGFLITFLLLTEIKRFGKVSLRNFYVRRTLRIWPLYYIIVLLSFFVVPWIAGADLFSQETYFLGRISELQFGANFILFLFFLSNLAMILYTPVAGAVQTWSVSVEEQFYAIWPLMMNLFRKRPWLAFTGVIILKPLCLYGISWLNRHYFHADALITVVKFLGTLDIELMAIGALGAWLLMNHKTRVEKIFADRRVMTAILFMLAIQLVAFSYMFPLGITFLALIYSFICCKISFRVFNFFGTISYGIYMYHPIVMFICYAVVNHLAIGIPAVYNIVVYLLILSLTIGLSYLSFHFIEKRFLHLKEKFSIVLSGKETDQV